MSDKSSIAIIGYSGHAFVVLEAALQSSLEILGYCERLEASYNPYNLKYLGFEGDVSFNWDITDKFALAIGENKIRHNSGKIIKSKNKDILNIVHPSAILSPTAKVGHGNFIGTNVIINALSRIGDYCILNNGCIIEHEGNIGDAAHIGPGAVLAGGVTIGRESFIGANSVIKQGINIGKNVIVGAGSTVLKDIPDNQIWVGNPAKILKK